MPRIRPLPRDQAAPAAQAVYDQDVELFGTVLNGTQVLAHRPSILVATGQLIWSAEDGSVVDPTLRALICLRVATQIGCPF